MKSVWMSAEATGTQYIVPPAGSTQYCHVASGGSRITGYDSVNNICRRQGIVVGLYVRVTFNTSPDDLQVSLYYENDPWAISVAIPAGLTGEFSDASSEQEIIPGGVKGFVWRIGT